MVPPGFPASFCFPDEGDSLGRGLNACTEETFHSWAAAGMLHGSSAGSKRSSAGRGHSSRPASGCQRATCSTRFSPQQTPRGVSRRTGEETEPPASSRWTGQDGTRLAHASHVTWCGRDPGLTATPQGHAPCTVIPDKAQLRCPAPPGCRQGHCYLTVSSLLEAPHPPGIQHLLVPFCP